MECILTLRPSLPPLSRSTSLLVQPTLEVSQAHLIPLASVASDYLSQPIVTNLASKWCHLSPNPLQPDYYRIWQLILGCEGKLLPLVFSLVGQFRNKTQGRCFPSLLPSRLVCICNLWCHSNVSSSSPHSHSVQLCRAALPPQLQRTVFLFSVRLVDWGSQVWG